MSRERTLCLVDLFGGTPSNTFCALSRKYDNVVVTGLNLGILLEVYMNKDQMTVDELAGTCSKDCTGKQQKCHRDFEGGMIIWLIFRLSERIFD